MLRFTLIPGLSSLKRRRETPFLLSLAGRGKVRVDLGKRQDWIFDRTLTPTRITINERRFPLPFREGKVRVDLGERGSDFLIPPSSPALLPTQHKFQLKLFVDLSQGEEQGMSIENDRTGLRTAKHMLQSFQYFLREPAHAQSIDRRNQPVSSSTREQPRRVVSVGRRGAG